MSENNYAIPPGSLVLVTGANGYIASHTIEILLEKGYKVRGTVRGPKPWLNSYFDKKYGQGRFESVVVPTMTDPDTWLQVLENVSGVLHLASDLSFSSDPNTVIPWVKQATVTLLEAAASHESVKRFVLTSSSAAAIIPIPNQEGIRVDENTWNETSIKAAWAESTPTQDRGYHVYAASKAEQERQAWRWMKERQPGFVLNVVVPNTNYGRVLLPEIPGSTMSWLWELLKGDDSLIRKFPPQWFVNVEDTARLHVVALLSPAVQGERIFAFASSFNWTDIINILKKLRPNNKLIPEPPANEGRDLSDIVLSRRAEELLREFFGQPGWIDLERSIAEGIEGLE
ncbi:aldehyde reductase [Penicillium fimorum]|uniref:Aldehyde reductase n=1 Tax=Penicillium fimorum TaxID=1882269 RepID=A0A9W9Y409_9EURO|nr:aldehyde reductase [Penicillium fimorum]